MQVLTRKAKLAIAKGLLTKRSPIYVQYAITGACNLNCRMCRSSESREKERTLSLSEIEELTVILEKLKVGIVVLTGGEPFLRDDLPEIIRKFVDRGITVRLQTNGLLATEEKIKEAVRAGLRGVTISLDSLSSARQREIDAEDDLWQERIRAIALFSNLLPKKGTMLGINTVVSKYNLGEVPKIVDFSTQIGFYSSLIPIHICPNENDFIIRTDASDFSFRVEDHSRIDQIYAKIIEMKKKGYNIYNSYRFLRESPDYLKYRKLYWKCESPDLYFAISPSGHFQPCIDIDTPVSILEEDFVYRFYSPKFRSYIREKIKNCPGCLYACWPEITYLCRDISVFLERLTLGPRLSLAVRRPVRYEECLRLIHQINESHFS